MLPTTRWGDHLYAHLLCLYYNGHWPRVAGGGLNDFMALLKASPEIDHPLRRQMSDKAASKEIVRERLGTDWCVPTLGYLRDDSEIDGFEFPHRCVIKATHSSGMVVFRRGGEPVDRALFKRWLRYSHYLKGRERNYRGIIPGIIVESWVEYAPGHELWVYCLRGEVVIITAFLSRFLGPVGSDQAWLRYSRDGTPHPLYGEEHLPINAARLDQWMTPQRMTQIIAAARVLSRDLLFLRVDMYLTDRTILIGELTSVVTNGLTVWEVPSEGETFDRSLLGEKGFCLEDFPELLN